MRESLEIFLALNDRIGIQFNLVGFGVLAIEANQRKRASRLGGAIESLRSATGAGLINSPLEFVDFSLPVKPTDDGEELAWWEEGKRMSAEEAAHYALDNIDTEQPISHR